MRPRWLATPVALLGSLSLLLMAGPAHAVLENPVDELTYSGIGVASGWACDAGELHIEFWGVNAAGDLTEQRHDDADRPLTFPLIYGSKRPDTETVCGDTDNGYVAIVNYGELPPGWHAAILYEDGEEIERHRFYTARYGEQPFVNYNVSEFADIEERASCVIEFPSGYATLLTFNSNTQHFEAEDTCLLNEERQCAE